VLVSMWLVMVVVSVVDYYFYYKGESACCMYVVPCDHIIMMIMFGDE